MEDLKPVARAFETDPEAQPRRHQIVYNPLTTSTRQMHPIGLLRKQ